MYMIGLFLILTAAFLIACLLDKETEDLLPPLVFSLLLCLYLIAIAGKAHHSFEAGLIIFALIWAFYILRSRRIFPKLSEIRSRLFTPAMIFYIVLVIAMFLAYSNHFITVWDDFHYNATLPKDMFCYGTMPTGNHSATLYRSYLPLMQLFFYWGFQAAGRFSEPMMFGYKMFLIYTCMLPVLKQLNGQRKLFEKILIGLCALLMPYLLMFELLESLSMDTFMALLFGYALLHIIFVKNKDTFTCAGVILSLSCLTMVKQLGILFTLIGLFVWLVILVTDYCLKDKDKRKLIDRESITWLVAAVINALLWLSWKVFCNIKGNSVYLSGKLKESVNGGGIVFPAYTASTVSAFIKSIFTYSLDLAPLGMTLFVAVFISLILFGISLKKEDAGKKERLGVTAVYLGLFGYLLVLVYTYLFVFEDWEAESLSSIDRYFGTYGLTLLYLSFGAVCLRIRDGKDHIRLLVLTLIFLVCTPWTNIYRNLIPGNYLDSHRQAYDDMNEVRTEMADIDPMSLEVRTVMVVTSEGNSIYSRGMLYNFIPMIPAEYIIEEASIDHSGELLERCADSSAYYVYFSGKLIEDKDKLASVSGTFDEGFVPKEGNLYYYDRDRNIICSLP